MKECLGELYEAGEGDRPGEELGGECEEVRDEGVLAAVAESGQLLVLFLFVEDHVVGEVGVGEGLVDQHEIFPNVIHKGIGLRHSTNT